MKLPITLFALGSLTLSQWTFSEANRGLVLPGMTAAGSPAAGALPQEVISELSNTPNPFDSRTTGLQGETEISYRLSGDYTVSVALYDLLGAPVRSWKFRAGENGGKSGLNAFRWDGTNEAGQKVAKGGYVAQLEITTDKTSVSALRKIAVIH